MVTRVSNWDRFVACILCCKCCHSKQDNQVSKVAQETLATHRKRQAAIEEQPKEIASSNSDVVPSKKPLRQVRLQSTEWISIRTALKYKGSQIVSH